MSSTRASRVDSHAFYVEYSGHQVSHLQTLLPGLRESADSLIWLAGDSSLDNKYWFDNTDRAVGPYAELLYPPRSKTDVAYWMNHLCMNDPSGRRTRTVTINTAVEASTLNERTFALRSQDKFIRDNISSDDILVLSVGGNDVALMPCPCTIASILGLLSFPALCIGKAFSFGTVPVDDCCCGCGASLLSCVCACPPCFGYFRHLFGTRVEKYISVLTSKTKPKKILVCMIYYPDTARTPSWAGGALGAFGYNSNPAKLQALINKAFTYATSAIRIPGSEVIPVPLFHVMDGTRPEDYIARVEPSPLGGRKMAEFILALIDKPDNAENAGAGPSSAIPSTSYMVDRS